MSVTNSRIAAIITRFLHGNTIRLATRGRARTKTKDGEEHRTHVYMLIRTAFQYIAKNLRNFTIDLT